MKIGLVLSKVPGYSETFMVSKVKGLVASGYQVTLFVNTGKKDVWHGAKVIPAANVSRFMLFKWLSVIVTSILVAVAHFRTTSRYWKRLRSEGESVACSLRSLYINAHVLKHQLDWLHFGFATMTLEREYVAKAVGAKMSVSFRGYDMNVYPLKYPGCYNTLWKEVDKVHSISKDLYEKAILNGLSKLVEFEVITPAINLSLFNYNNRGSDEEQEVQLFTVARLSWIKGLEYAISAVSILKKQGINVNYSIAGDGDLYERLMFAIHQYDVEDCVTLIGAQSPQAILSRMQQCLIYLQPSLEEGFCNAVIEAQACGCLCIVSNTGGLKENVIDSETGWLVPKRDAKALALKIKDVIDLKVEEKMKIREAAVRRVEQQFNLQTQVKKFVEFYS